MTFGFVTYERKLFTNLSDEKTVLFSAERDTIVTAVIVCNKSDSTVPSIRINLQSVALLENPVQEAFFVFNLLVQKNESMNLLSLKDQNNDITPLFLKDGDNLVCYSNGFSERFDCTVYYRELNELNDEFI